MMNELNHLFETLKVQCIKFPKSIDEFIYIGNCYEKVFEFYDENIEFRNNVKQLVDLSNSETKKEVKDIIISILVDRFSSDYHKMSNFCSQSENENQRKAYISIIASSIINQVIEIGQNNINKEEFWSTLSKVLHDKKLIYNLLQENINDIDIKKFYDDNFLAVFNEIYKDRYEYISIDNYYLLCIVSDLFTNYYKHLINPYSIKSKRLETIYRDKNYDLNQENQYEKYGLVEIDNSRELLISDSRILDKKVNISYEISLIDFNVYKVLLEYFEKYNFTLSFAPDNESIYDFIFDSTLTTEAVEFGVSPTIETLRTECSHKIKFVDYTSKDTFWIRNINSDFYIEEIVSDFVEHQDSIVTKLIHIEHGVKDEELYIKHIDFEYIFYSVDEFINRYEENNFTQKGEKYKRKKIFKIDEALIPFSGDFLYPIVYFTFDNKELVKEALEGMEMISNV